MKNLLLLLALITLCVCNANSQTTRRTQDFQFWYDTTVAFPIIKRKDKSDKVTFFISGTFRAGKNVSRAIDERIGFGFDLVANKYVTFTPSYLYRAGQPVAGGKEFEHRLRFDTTLNRKFTNFSIKDRNRIEYRIRHSRADSVRYRNKFTFTVPVKKDKKEIFAPFIATEPFYDFHEKKWTRNELSVGIGKKFSHAVSAEFYYLWQRNIGATLKNVNAIGVNLKFRVDRDHK
jgi:hypothetical protein